QGCSVWWGDTLQACRARDGINDRRRARCWPPPRPGAQMLFPCITFRSASHCAYATPKAGDTRPAPTSAIESRPAHASAVEPRPAPAAEADAAPGSIAVAAPAPGSAVVGTAVEARPVTVVATGRGIAVVTIGARCDVAVGSGCGGTTPSPTAPTERCSRCAFE